METKQESEIMKSIEKCKEAQKQLKKRQQKYCIEQYYKKKEAEQKKKMLSFVKVNANIC